ncbi:MAG: HAD hydrolase-like protein [Armatimonadetes bacterium]|nr:HAD hydrolase-like protein [Armatimonadota bacterium]
MPRCLKKYLNTKSKLVIVSDLDRTLIDLKVQWSKVIEDLKRRGFLRSNESLQELYYRVHGSHLFEKINNIVTEYELEAVDELAINNALKKLLDELKKLNVSICIVTKQSRIVVKEVLNKLGILNYVECYIGREDSALRISQIRKCLHYVKCREQCFRLGLGDTLVDIKSFVRLGMIPILITMNDPIKKYQGWKLKVPYANNAYIALRAIYKLIKSYQ